MSFQIPLDRMTVAEKWEALHAIWSDLAQNPGEIPVPDWHKPVLESRLALIAAGRAEFQDWDDAIAEIAKHE